LSVTIGHTIKTVNTETDDTVICHSRYDVGDQGRAGPSGGQGEVGSP